MLPSDEVEGGIEGENRARERADRPRRIRRRRKKRRAVAHAAPAAGELVSEASPNATSELAGDTAQADGPGVHGNGRLTPELATLLDEAESPQGQGPEKVLEAAPPEIPREMFVRIAGAGVKAVGALACKWARVSPLESDEISDLAGALYELAAAYDVLGQVDPRTAALLNVGLVVSTIAINRKRLDPDPPAPSSAELERAVAQPHPGLAPDTAAPGRIVPTALDLNSGFQK